MKKARYLKALNAAFVAMGVLLVLALCGVFGEPAFPRLYEKDSTKGWFEPERKMMPYRVLKRAAVSLRESEGRKVSLDEVMEDVISDIHAGGYWSRGGGGYFNETSAVVASSTPRPDNLLDFTVKRANPWLCELLIDAHVNFKEKGLEKFPPDPWYEALEIVSSDGSKRKVALEAKSSFYEARSSAHKWCEQSVSINFLGL